MARVLVLTADLLFGSRVQSQLAAGGHDAELIGDPGALRARLGDREGPSPELLVVDLTDPDLDGAALIESLRGSEGAGELLPPSLGYYSHVDVSARERAERAGFDLVVPRSRMAREGAALAGSLVSSRAG